MNNNNTHVIEQTHLDPYARKYLLIMYALYGASWLGFVITPIIAVVIAYSKQNDWGDSIYRDHAQYIIRTFWVTLIGTLVSLPLVLLFGLGFATMTLVWAWFGYRSAFGAWRIWKYRGVNPQAWLELP